jgi:hypothetical protein
MPRYLRTSEIRAELASIESLLGEIPEADIVGRYSLESRKRSLAAQLREAEEGVDTLASTALYFSGTPVIGSMGIDAQFASKAIAGYQDLVSKILVNPDPRTEPSVVTARSNTDQLHVTALLHGSLGFLIEELEPRAVPLFPTPLKQATDRADDVIVQLADASDEGFEQQIEFLAPPVFNAARHFFTTLHRAEASMRLVDASHDATLRRDDIDRAFVRLEDSSVDEGDFIEEGLLIGIIPVGGRFEFRRDSGELVTGKVATTLSEAYLQRLENEQAIGRRWRATIKRREVKRFGRSKQTFKLLDLQEVQ